MARQVRIPITNDDEIISTSPLTYADILYYETWYRITDSANWTQQIDYHPLEEYLTAVSPETYQACIVLNNLADDTDYEVQIRRFNSDNTAGEWVEDTFNSSQDPVE